MSTFVGNHFVLSERQRLAIVRSVAADEQLKARKAKEITMRREGLFLEFISFVNNPDGTPRYENTYQYAILIKEWDERELRITGGR